MIINAIAQPGNPPLDPWTTFVVEIERPLIEVTVMPLTPALIRAALNALTKLPPEERAAFSWELTEERIDELVVYTLNETATLLVRRLELVLVSVMLSMTTLCTLLVSLPVQDPLAHFMICVLKVAVAVGCES